jgi:hypothetical protein
MNESTTARRDGNTLKHFDAMNPTKAQLRDMGRILALARLTHPSSERRIVFGRSRMTLFALSMFLKMSSRRLSSLVDGMVKAKMLTNDNGRLTVTPGATMRRPFVVRAYKTPAPGATR